MLANMVQARKRALFCKRGRAIGMERIPVVVAYERARYKNKKTRSKEAISDPTSNENHV
jgi:hypothetical protein